MTERLPRGAIRAAFSILVFVTVVSAAPLFAQTAMWGGPSTIYQGECYWLTVNAPWVTVDVQYTFNGGGAQTIWGWPSFDGSGNAYICSDMSTPPGTYTYVAFKNSGSGSWIGTYVPITVLPTPQPDFAIWVSPQQQTVVQPGTRSYTIGVDGYDGFYNWVDLWLDSSPAGGYITPSSILPGQTATLVLYSSGAPTYTWMSAYVGAYSPGVGYRYAYPQIYTYPPPPPNPTSFNFNSSSGYAGNDGFVVTVGNGANMSLDLQYTLNGTPLQGTIQLNGAGQYSYNLSHNEPTGVYHYTAMKNAASGTWVGINTTYTINPPQPSSFNIVETSITPGGSAYTINVGNGGGVTLDMQATLDGVPQPTMWGWPALAGNPDGTAVIPVAGCTLPGHYVLGPVKNTQNGPWVPVSDTIDLITPAPSVTSVSPSTILPGQSVTVTFQGSHLCDPAFTTSWPGLSISNVSYDTLDGTWATAQVTAAAGVTLGTAGINVSATSGSTGVNFGVAGQQPSTFSFNTSSGYAGDDDFTVTVGNGANMTLGLKFTVAGGPALEGTIPLDANGQHHYDLLQNEPTGAYVYTHMRNAADPNAGWIDMADVTYTILPPQPRSMTANPSSFTPPATYDLTVENGANVTLDYHHTFDPPDGPVEQPPATYGWPALVPAAPGSPDGVATIPSDGCTPPGVYTFTLAKNTLNGAWKDIPDLAVTVIAVSDLGPVSPSGALPGSAVTVTMTGSHLCDPEFDTTYPGITFSSISHDPDGVEATATFTVAPGTPSGVAEITMTNIAGAVTFNFGVATASAPAVTAIVPAVRPAGSTSTVTIQGANLIGAELETAWQGLEFSGYDWDPSGTAMTATFTIDAGAPQGTPTIVLTTPAGPLPTTLFTIGDPQPVLTREYIYLGGRVIAVEGQ